MAEPTPEQRSLLQFSLRSLFVAAMVVALIAAAAAPGIQTLDRDQLIRLTIVLAASMFLAAVFVVVTCYFRWKLLQKAGRLVMRVSTPRRAWYHALYMFNILVGLAVFFAGPIAWVITAKSAYSTGVGPPWLATIDYWLMAIIMPIGWIQTVVFYAVYVWWWQLDPTTIEARERGLILRSRKVVPWTDIKSHRWKSTGRADLILQLHYEVVDLRIAPRDKEAFDRLLHEMCVKQSQQVPEEPLPSSSLTN